MKTPLEILNKHIDFSKDGIVERESSIKAMEEYAAQCQQDNAENINKQLIDAYNQGHRNTVASYSAESGLSMHQTITGKEYFLTLLNKQDK